MSPTVRHIAVLAAVVCGAAALSACHQAAPVRDVLIVVVDTLRADRLGRYGNDRGLTPFLDQLADRGVRFANAYSASSWTNPSVAALFTSRFPSQTEVHDFDSKLPDSEVTFAERLGAAGFSNAGFTANWRLTADLGFAQGFGPWRGFLESPGSPKKARGDVVRQAAFDWLDTLAKHGHNGPRLLYLQFMEPHGPYLPTAAMRARFAPQVSDAVAAEANRKALQVPIFRDKVSDEEQRALHDLYDAEVASVDAELALLFDGLAQRGFLDHALVIVTADHGEELFDHGDIGHGLSLYNETVHVPLIVAGPGVPAGKVVTENVSLTDLAPTLLDLAGLPPEPRFQGRSIASLLHGAASSGHAADVLVELPPNNSTVDARVHSSGLVRGMSKLLLGVDGTPKLYDLAADPGEHAPSGPPATKPLTDALATRVDQLADAGRAHAEKAPIDDATKEKLRALGYHF